MVIIIIRTEATEPPSRPTTFYNASPQQPRRRYQAVAVTILLCFVIALLRAAEEFNRGCRRGCRSGSQTAKHATAHRRRIRISTGCSRTCSALFAAVPRDYANSIPSAIIFEYIDNDNITRACINVFGTYIPTLSTADAIRY